MIEIINPSDNTPEVGISSTVFGRVDPPELPVQLWVLANDARWYLQAPVVVAGTTFTGTCVYGKSAGTVGLTYSILATSGRRLPGKPVRELPDDIQKSLPVKVRRIR
jgi:hypothetical protein